MKILVLGGDGFIGSHLVDCLASLDHIITVFDRFKYDSSNNLEPLRDRINFISGEFGNREQVADALADQDIVYHCISMTTPATSWKDPYVEILENLKNSVQCFELAAEMGVRKIVFCSSGGTVYGIKQGLIDEKELPEPFSPYGICKLTIEHFLNYFRHYSDLSFDIYRIGNAYGPRQPMKTAQGVISVWMGNILSGNELMVYGDNETVRDYVYVRDIASLMLHSLNCISSSDVYNISSGEGFSIIQLLDIFKSVIPQPFKYKVLPSRKFDNKSVILDNSKILSHFPGFKFNDLKEGIRDTWTAVCQDRQRIKYENF